MNSEIPRFLLNHWERQIQSNKIQGEGSEYNTFGSQMAMVGAGPFAIMKVMGHDDIKTTMIYVSLGRNHIRQ